MNYLVIDLEMCKVPKMYRSKAYHYAHETIQIGAVLLDEDFRQIGTLSQYVHPEHGVLDHFISDLTGIHNCNVKQAPLLRETLLHMIDWIGEREYKVISWSSTDLTQLQQEVRSKCIEDPKIAEFMDPERWIDYQEVFDRRYDFNRTVGLQEALMDCEIDPDGRAHDGLFDAINTAKLICKLEHDPDFQIHHYEPEKTGDTEPLGFSLGDLFAGLDIKISA